MSGVNGRGGKGAGKEGRGAPVAGRLPTPTPDGLRARPTGESTGELIGKFQDILTQNAQDHQTSPWENELYESLTRVPTALERADEKFKYAISS